MTMRQLLRFKTGQALVEFALAATLIFFLLAAAVDLGLIFFTIQGLHNAAQDGAAYGSRWLITTTDASGNQLRVLDENAIRERVRKESGTRGGIGFVNLLDLNNNGTPDVGPTSSAVVGAAGTTYEMSGATRVIDSYIKVEMLLDSDSDGDPLDDLVNGQPTPCTNPGGKINCFIRVTAMTDYRTVFPLAPSFAQGTTLRSSYVMPLRDAFSQSGVAGPTAPVVSTVTPTPLPPTPVPLTVSVTRYSKDRGTSRPVKIKVSVQRQGQPISGAVVTLTINGSSVNLTDAGNGVYYNCSAGFYDGDNSPVGTVSAIAGTSTGSVSTGTGDNNNANCP
jgi:TadE-like protein